MRDPRIKVGSVVQLNETASSPCYVSCLLVVTEIKSFGVQGYVAIPGDCEFPAGQAYLRPKWEAIEYIGEAVLVRR